MTSLQFQQFKVPNGPLLLNTGNQLAKDVIALVNPLAGLWDLPANVAMANTSTTRTGVGGIVSNGSSSYASRVPLNQAWFDTSGATILVITTPLAVGSGSCSPIASFACGGARGGFSIGVNSSGIATAVALTSNGASYTAGTSTRTNLRSLIAATRLPGGGTLTMPIWVNGVRESNNNGNVSGNTAHGGAAWEFGIGRGPGFDINGGTTYSNAATELIIVWNRVLSDAEILSISVNPYQIFKARRLPVWINIPSYVPDTALAATLIGSTSVTASLSTQIALAASLTGATTLTASLATPAALAANLACAVTVTAGLTTAIPLTATMTAVATLTSSLSTQITPTAALTAVTTVNAALTTAITLVASLGCVATVGASLTTAIPLTASLGGVCTLTADLSVGAGLSANLAVVSTLTASLTTAIPLASNLASVSTVTAGLTTAIPLIAALSNATTLTASLTTGNGLSASIGGVCTLTANLTTGIAMQASLVGQTTVTSGLTTAITLGANLASAATITANLLTSIRLAASMVNVTTLNANLTANGVTGLSATLASQSIATANLTTAILMRASLQAQVTLSAYLGSSVRNTPNSRTLVVEAYGTVYDVQRDNRGYLIEPEVDGFTFYEV